MSGFFVLHWPLNADSVEIQRIKAEASLRLRESHPLSTRSEIATVESPGFWCARLDTPDSPSSQNVVHAQERSWIFKIGSATYQGKRTSDRALGTLLRDISQNPEAAAASLDGVFAVVAFDSPGQRAWIIPSALQLYAVYFRFEKGMIGVSSSVLALAALGPVTLDEFHCQSLHRCGHRLPPHTIFNEVRSAPEGSLIELASGRCEIKRYWAPAFDRNAAPTISAAANDISEELANYCTTLIDPQTEVFSDLTGGYDSRVSTAALLRSGIPFTATVAGTPGDPDVLACRRICESEKLPLQVVDTMEDPDTLADDVASALLLSEGCVDVFSFATTLRAKRALLARAAPHPVTTVGGGFGECYRDFFWAHEFLDRGKYQPASIEKIIRYRLDTNLSPMDHFAADWRPEWRARLHEYFQGIIEPFSGERNTAQLDAVYLRKMTGMIGAFTTAVSRFSVSLSPFACRAVLDLALGVPPNWRYDSRLFRHVAHALAPSLAEHQTLSGCPCAPMTARNWYRFLPRYRMQAERLIRKVGGVWFDKALFPDYIPPDPPRNPYLALLDAETRTGGHLDWESMLTAAWYSPDALAQLVHEGRQPGGYRLRHCLSRIYTVEAMIRKAQSPVSRSLAVSDRPAA